jgi:uncharacterized membrane protein (DUF485 family)
LRLADWEAAVTDGFILLGLLAVIFAVLVARGRRWLGVRVTGRTFAWAIAGFAIVVLILWATQRRAQP